MVTWKKTQNLDPKSWNYCCQPSFIIGRNRFTKSSGKESFSNFLFFLDKNWLTLSNMIKLINKMKYDHHSSQQFWFKLSKLNFLPFSFHSFVVEGRSHLRDALWTLDPPRWPPCSLNGVEQQGSAAGFCDKVRKCKTIVRPSSVLIIHFLACTLSHHSLRLLHSFKA